MVDFFSQFVELLRVVEEVKEERGEGRLRGIGSSNNNEVTVVEDNLKWYFFFFCTEFIGLRRQRDRV